MLYCLADGKNEMSVEHLRAALAVWSRCESSAKLLFSHDSPSDASPEPTWLKLLSAIQRSPGINRRGLYKALHSHLKAEELDTALTQLGQCGLAHQQGESWWPGAGEQESSEQESMESSELDGEQESNESMRADDNCSPLSCSHEGNGDAVCSPLSCSPAVVDLGEGLEPEADTKAQADAAAVPETEADAEAKVEKAIADLDDFLAPIAARYRNRDAATPTS